MAVRRFPVPVAEMRQGNHARWAKGERWEQPPDRLASTVMLVREGAGTGEPEVFMIRRVTQMAFAPNVLVFPGGGVDARDAGELRWAGPEPAEWAQRMGVSPVQAQQIVAAAVRELFEECGVFLVSAEPDGPLVDGTDARWRGVRDALVAKEVALSQVLDEHGLWLRSDRLVIRAHWVPPGYVMHRFSTWFFAARLPDNQQADGDTSESQHAEWVCPATLLADIEAAHVDLMPPTLHALETLRDSGGVEAFMAHRDPLLHVRPEIVTVGDDEYAIEIDFPD